MKTTYGYLLRRGRTWVAVWTHGGKKYRVSTGETSRRAAETKLAELVAPFRLSTTAETVSALAKKADVLKAAAGEMMGDALQLSKGWSAYLAARNRPDTGPDTLVQYEHQFGVFIRWMKDRYPDDPRFNDVTRTMAREFAGFLEKQGRTANTVNKYLNLLDLIWRVLAEPARIEVNPWGKDTVTRRRMASGTGRRELTIPELKTLTERAEGEMRTLLAIGMYGGLRLGDAARLAWEEVDFRRGVIVTTPHKTSASSGAIVAIPLSAPLRRVLEETPSSARLGPIMPGMAELYLRNRYSLSHVVQRHFESCGIATTEKIPGRSMPRTIRGFHSLRHSFITHAAMSGWPEALVRSIVGHTSGAVTKRYIHTSVEAAKSLPQMPDVLALTDGAPETPAPVDWRAEVRRIAATLPKKSPQRAHLEALAG